MYVILYDYHKVTLYTQLHIVFFCCMGDKKITHSIVIAEMGAAAIAVSSKYVDVHC